MRKHPDAFSRPLKDQWDILIKQPLEKANDPNPDSKQNAELNLLEVARSTIILVVDALDEFSEDGATKFLSLLENMEGGRVRSFVFEPSLLVGKRL